MAAVPVRDPITIPAGDDYAHVVTFEDAAHAPVDVSARTFTAQIRSNPNVTAAVLEEFTVDATDAATGTIVLRLTAAQTRELATLVNTGGMDVQQVVGGVTTTLFRCEVDTEGEYTR